MMNDKQPLDNQTKWREDFPVDDHKEQFVKRREFTKFLLLISGSFVIGQLYIVLKQIFQKKEQTALLHPIANMDDFQDKKFLSFEYPHKGDHCLLIQYKDSYLAYSAKCTHLLCPVIPKIEEKKFHCPCHQGFFDMESGVPLAGPPSRPLPKIKLKIIGRNIYANGIEI